MLSPLYINNNVDIEFKKPLKESLFLNVEQIMEKSEYSSAVQSNLHSNDENW